MVIPQPPHLRFHESLHQSRAMLLRRLLTQQYSHDGEYTTIRLGDRKCHSLDPTAAHPNGTPIFIFLGDNKITPTLTGRAFVIRCTKTLLRYFIRLPPDHPDIRNCLEGKKSSVIEHYLKKFYQQNTISQDDKISIITIRF